MELLETMMKYEHEQVVYCSDPHSGLKAIIAIHDTTLGPALGGLRMWPYESEEAALIDVLRLSRGMTYKNAAAGLNLGGGKAVIIGDPSIKSEALYRSFGRYVESLGGRYITAEDMNTSTDDIMQIREETDHVSGIDEAIGGAGTPSPFTALGVFEGIKISVLKRLNRDSLEGLTIALQGVGSVGKNLCALLHQAGAQLRVSDIQEDSVQEMVEQYGAQSVSVADIYSVEADIFVPCAMGAILNDETIPQLKCSVIAGAANNQLLDEAKHSQMLQDKEILYAPDYIINAGGVINCYYEVIGEYTREAVEKKVQAIYQTLERVYQISEEQQISSHEAAAHFAETRIKSIARVHQNFLGRGY